MGAYLPHDVNSQLKTRAPRAPLAASLSPSLSEYISCDPTDMAEVSVASEGVDWELMNLNATTGKTAPSQQKNRTESAKGDSTKLAKG